MYVSIFSTQATAKYVILICSLFSSFPDATCLLCSTRQAGCVITGPWWFPLPFCTTFGSSFSALGTFFCETIYTIFYVLFMCCVLRLQSQWLYFISRTYLPNKNYVITICLRLIKKNS